MFQGLEELSPLPTCFAPSAPTLDRLEVIRERSRGDIKLKPGGGRKTQFAICRCNSGVHSKMKGRPLTRDEERRMAAEASRRPLGSRSPRVSRRDSINPMDQFAPLFLLGMLGGIAVVFIALFVL